MDPWPTLWDPTGTSLVAVLDKAYDVVVVDEILTADRGQEVLDFSLPLSYPKAALIQNEMLVRVSLNASEEIGAVDSFFHVRTPVERQQGGSKTVSFHCESRWYELGTAEPLTLTPAVATPLAALTAILAGTGWVVGEITVEPPDGASFALGGITTPLAAIRALPATFGGEVVFDTIARTVSLVPARGVETGLLFSYRKHLTSATRTTDTTSLITRAHPIGANGLDISLVMPGGLHYIDDYSYYDDRGWPRQVRSAPLENDQIVDPTLLLAWAQQELAKRAQPTHTYEVQVALLRGRRVPGVGDVLRIRDVEIHPPLDTYARVAQRTLDVMRPHLSSIQIDTSLPLLIDALPGAPGSPGGTGVARVDTTIPAPPTGLDVAFGDAIDVNGRHVVYGGVTWVGATTNDDGSPMVDFDHYDLRYRIVGTATWTSGGSTTLLAASTGLLWQGGQLEVQVRSVDRSGHSSTWAAGTFDIDDPDPSYAAPSPPILDATSLPSAIRAVWDGLDAAGHAPPADLAYCEVHLSTTTFGSGPGQIQPSIATLIDHLPGPGASPLLGLVAGTTYHVCFRFVGSTGVPGLASVDVSAVPRLIGGPELDPRAITDTDHSEYLDADSQFSGGTLVADVAAPSGQARLLTSGATATSTAYTDLKPGRYKATVLVSNAAAVTVLSTQLGTLSVSAFAGAVLPDAPRPILVSDLTITPDYRTVSVNFTVLATGATVVIVVAGAASQSLKVAAAYVEPVIVAAGLEVNSAMIGSVLADSILAGSIRADLSVLARIKTADSGARAEINSTGIFLYDTGGNVVVGLPISGNATFKGSILAGSVIVGTEFHTSDDTTAARVLVLPAGASGIQSGSIAAWGDAPAGKTPVPHGAAPPWGAAATLSAASVTSGYASSSYYSSQWALYSGRSPELASNSQGRLLIGPDIVSLGGNLRDGTPVSVSLELDQQDSPGPRLNLNNIPYLSVGDGELHGAGYLRVACENAGSHRIYFTDTANTDADIQYHVAYPSSSLKIKRDVVPIASFLDSALAHVRAVGPIRYKRKQPRTDGGPDQQYLGFAAEDLDNRLEGLVVTSEISGLPAYSMNGVVALLWQAVRELDAEIAQLRKKAA